MQQCPPRNFTSSAGPFIFSLLLANPSFLKCAIKSALFSVVSDSHLIFISKKSFIYEKMVTSCGLWNESNAHLNALCAMIGLFLYPCWTLVNWYCFPSHENVVISLELGCKGMPKSMSVKSIVARNLGAICRVFYVWQLSWHLFCKFIYVSVIYCESPLVIWFLNCSNRAIIAEALCWFYDVFFQ